MISRHPWFAATAGGAFDYVTSGRMTENGGPFTFRAALEAFEMFWQSRRIDVDRCCRPLTLR
jgi:hypothetical protein